MAWPCDALGVLRSGFHAWLNRLPSARSRSDEELGGKVKASFMASDRTYGAGRVWREVLADGADCGLHQIERLMRLQGLRARPRRRRLPKRTAAIGSSRQCRQTCWIGSSLPSDRTRSGSPTSPTFGRLKDGSTCRPSSTCSRDGWLASR